MIRVLLGQRDLVYMLTLREIKLRYKQSVMGFLWAILMPLVIILAGIVVRYAFATVSGRALERTDLALVTVKAVPWAFVVTATRFATNSLVANTNLVTKIYMPREIFPVSSILSQLVDFVVAATAAAVMLAILGTGLSVHVLWVVVLVPLLVTLVAGAGIVLAPASLFFRDVKYLVEVVLTFAIFFTPVFYEAETFQSWAPVLLLNPVAPVFEALGASVVHHRTPDLGWLAYSAVVAVAVLAGGIRLFKRLEPYFAESA